MAFEIQFKKSVQKDLRAITRPDQKRLFGAIQAKLSRNPYQGKALGGEFKGLYRWRSGRFRVIYEIKKDASIVLVLRIGHRKEVYR